jgi:phosphoenolpyruvate-protein kinase (PTS system EI component)
MLDGSVNTLDGVSITFEASVSDAKSALKARQSNAAAIGLVRSEFLGSVGERAPTIEEYVQAATELLQAAGELAITWRLLDIGGEKIFPWIKPSAALRDSLGGRGCRTYADPSIRPVIRSQIEALKQVDVHGQYSLVVPYVSSYDEFRRVRHDLESNLGADRFKIGAMLETPSACLAAVCISGDADFVSIGTNDLVQAFFGASRTFTETEGYIDPYAPPLLRFLANTSKQQTEKFASYRICGQLPLLPFVFEYLVGIGFRRFSLEPLALAGVAERCSRISASKLAIASEEAANQCDSGSVIRCLSSATGA